MATVSSLQLATIRFLSGGTSATWLGFWPEAPTPRCFSQTSIGLSRPPSGENGNSVAVGSNCKLTKNLPDHFPPIHFNTE